MHFAKSLKKIREERGLLQQELADKLEIAQSTIGMWEAGKRTPKIGELNRLAKFLGISVTRLLGERHAGVSEPVIIVNGKEIDISEVDDTDLKDIIEYIKSKKEKCREVFPSQMKQLAKKVLIVDDDRQICEMLYSLLRQQNYRVFLAFNGRMGLEYFEEVKPDIVLLDIKMPDMSGLEVLKIIRKTSNIPVTILTGHPGRVSEMYPSELNIQGYIEKPISQKMVLDTLRCILG